MFSQGVFYSITMADSREYMGCVKSSSGPEWIVVTKPVVVIRNERGQVEFMTATMSGNNDEVRLLKSNVQAWCPANEQAVEAYNDMLEKANDV